MTRSRSAAPSFAIRGISGMPAILVLAVSLAATSPAIAADTTVAVAANFSETARKIATAFEKATGHKMRLAFGATGQLYAQITQGAPFDVFLAADRQRPMLAEQNGWAVPGSRFTYATGRLVLYSRDAERVRGRETLQRPDFRRLALANPKTAPYGKAAMEVITSLGLLGSLNPRLVFGNNISQAYQFVATGNAEMGFISYSLVKDQDTGSMWIVPEDLHSEIAQDAVLLKQGAENRAAVEFMAFLRGKSAAVIKRRFGYGIGN